MNLKRLTPEQIMETLGEAHERRVFDNILDAADAHDIEAEGAKWEADNRPAPFDSMEPDAQ